MFVDSLDAKRGNVLGGARDGGIRCGRAALFHIAKTSQDPAHDVLILNASSDSSRTTAADAHFNLPRAPSLDAGHQFTLSILNMRLSRVAQFIAA